MKTLAALVFPGFQTLDYHGPIEMLGDHDEGSVDIKIVAIDAVPDAHLAIANGEMNATIELTPNMAGPAFDALAAYWAGGTLPPKFIQTESALYTQADDPAAEYEARKDLGY